VNDTAELAAALAKVQAELPEVGKNRTAEVKNKEGKYLYSYTYADLADVSAAVLPVLGKHGLAFAAFPGHQDGRFGLRYYLLHSSGQSIEGFFQLDDSGGIQLTGGRITYARRYCLCAVTGITADEDVDAKDDAPSRTVQRRPPRDAGTRPPQQTAQRRTSSPPPAQAAPPSAGPPSSPAGAGGALPPLPGQTRTAADYIAERMTMLGVENHARTAARITGRPLGSLDELSPAEANHVMRTVRGCKTAADLDGVLADLAMENDPRGSTDE
jgi:ERF superfamily protein